jgi:hypothetical protein
MGLAMASFAHMATPEDDRRHVPGPDAMPLWNESFWFPFYDPAHQVGMVLRFGSYAKQNKANLFLYLTRGSELVHSFIDHHLPVPAHESGRCTIAGLTIDWEQPLERFRLRYANGPHAFDVVWQATSPAYTYPRPPDTSYDLVPGHIEQAGRVTGRMTIGGTSYAIDCHGHRDHSWGGERDWAKFHRWNYLSGDFGPADCRARDGARAATSASDDPCPDDDSAEDTHARDVAATALRTVRTGGCTPVP